MDHFIWIFWQVTGTIIFILFISASPAIGQIHLNENWWNAHLESTNQNALTCFILSTSDMCCSEESLFQLWQGRDHSEGSLYIAWKNTNDCWVVDSICRTRQSSYDLYEYNVAESVRMFSVRLKMLFKTPRELCMSGWLGIVFNKCL